MQRFISKNKKILLDFLQRHWVKIALFFLLISTFYIRFKHLGYSEYCLDEPGSFIFGGVLDSDENVIDFILNQRKGPMQFIFSLIPRLIVGDYRNEFAQRLPFALSSFFAVFACYLAVEKLTGKKLLAVLSACFLSVNGFVVAFGRTAQYQSLNILFSFLSVYFYAFLLPENSVTLKSSTKTLLKRSIFGTFFISLSLLSHWDAVYFAPLIIFIFIRFLASRDFSKKFKIRILVTHFLTGVLLLAPFFIPYLSTYLKNEGNQNYFLSRVGQKDNTLSAQPLVLDLQRIVLYNPIFTLNFYIIFGILGVLADVLGLFWKKVRTSVSGLSTIWFVLVLCAFYFFVSYAGTHIYNLMLPGVFLVSLGFWFLFRIFPHFYKLIPVTLFSVSFLFFLAQAYQIYVDVTYEYPWERDHVWGYPTGIYSNEDVVVQRNKLGFPIKRNWKEIAEFLREENSRQGKNLNYITNDDSSVANFYTGLEYSQNELPYYAIGIKRPASFVKDYTFPQIKGKHTIKKIELNGETVARIYLVDGKD